MDFRYLILFSVLIAYAATTTTTTPRTTTRRRTTTRTTTTTTPRTTTPGTTTKCMVELQVCRASYQHKWIDLAGYSKCVDEVYCQYGTTDYYAQQDLKQEIARMRASRETTTTRMSYDCLVGLQTCAKNYQKQVINGYTLAVWEECVRNVYCPYGSPGRQEKETMLDAISAMGKDLRTGYSDFSPRFRASSTLVLLLAVFWSLRSLF